MARSAMQRPLGFRSITYCGTAKHAGEQPGVCGDRECPRIAARSRAMRPWQKSPRSARAVPPPQGGTRRDALSSRVVSARSALFVRQEAFVGRVQNKLDRRRIANKGKVQWRHELANITDLDAAFTDVLCGLNPDVLHIHDIHLLGAGVVAKARLQAAGRHVPLIYDAHEYIAGMKSRQLLAEAAYLAMEHELVPSVDAIITVSEPIAVRIQQDYGLAERPTVVLNVPPLADIALSSRNLREEVGVGGAPLLVYSGVLGVQRNVRSVIAALPLLPGAHFAVVCVPSPDAPAARQLAVLAEETGVADRFHLVAPVPTQRNRLVPFHGGCGYPSLGDGAPQPRVGAAQQDFRLPARWSPCGNQPRRVALAAHQRHRYRRNLRSRGSTGHRRSGRTDPRRSRYVRGSGSRQGSAFALFLGSARGELARCVRRRRWKRRAP